MPQLIDTPHLIIALAPLAVYLFVIGVLHLSPRPVCLTGARETLGLGLAVSGMILIGPMELFVPAATAFQLGGYVWLLLIAFYGMSLLLVVLVRRPRLVVYNVSEEQMRAVLASIVSELDRDARWAGDCLFLPALGVQLSVEAAPLVRYVELVSAGVVQSFEGWGRLETSLRHALRQQTRTRGLYGAGLVLASLALAGLMALSAVSSPLSIAQLREMLHVAP
ncbi:MAG: hypothetical protein AB7F89_07550 [Pirellulaceae bacterium]